MTLECLSLKQIREVKPAGAVSKYCQDVPCILGSFNSYDNMQMWSGTRFVKQFCNRFAEFYTCFDTVVAES